MLVFTQVSSMKTRLAEVRSGWACRQIARAAATSGRSCSAAWSVFFTRQAERLQVAVERRAPHRDPLDHQPIPQFVERVIWMARHQVAHQCPMSGEHERLPGTLGRRHAPGSLPVPYKLDRAALADGEPLRR
jgi:hypothetical protein